jgi:5,10-methylenetetrahydrofolate reductase
MLRTGRPLGNALQSAPLFFEPVPPVARTPAAVAEERLAALVRLIEMVPRVDAFVIPELVDENHEGKPRYRSSDLAGFATGLERRTGRAAIVNKVVAHLGSTAELEQWARESVARGVRNVVLVGGASRYIPYPGPSVVEAARISRPFFLAQQGLVGHVAIPQRRGEAHRMLSKTRAGGAFFTTQILFDTEQAIDTIREYDLLCRQAATPPSAVVVSFAPITSEMDLEFVRWLGADVSDAAEVAILEGAEAETAARSEARVLQVWDGIVTAARKEDIAVPLGVNVEQITPRHLEPASHLLRCLAERPPFGPV